MDHSRILKKVPADARYDRVFAVTEMEGLDTAFVKMRECAPRYGMPAFDALRTAAQSGAAVHRQYGGSAPGSPLSGE